MRLFIGLLVIILICLSGFAACKSTTTTSAIPQISTSQTAVSTSNVPAGTGSPGSQWWGKFGVPQYGGTLNLSSDLSTVGFDPGSMMGTRTSLFWLEALLCYDWALDRNIWPYATGWTPIEHLKGSLAESWEQPDPATVIVHVRHNIHWQNKPPVNGRELDANDIQYTFDRLMGTGSGFTSPNPQFVGMMTAVDRAVATDKYTVKFTFKKPGVFAIYQALGVGGSASIVPHEWVELGGPPSSAPPAGEPPGGGPPGGGPPPGGPPGPPGPGGAGAPSGPLNDWKNAVGTGPWILSDFVSGSSMTLGRNPDYWDVDARYPQNKVPYLDSVKILNIIDTATALAAFRTGKIDLGTEASWQDISQLTKDVPDLQIKWIPDNTSCLDMRCDTKPFNDINVRKALQMAVDIKIIAKTIYGGTSDGIPVGMISPLYKDWTTPYSEWPKSLQDEYTYNPTKAKELLAAAGYPNGFNTSVILGTPTGTGNEVLIAIQSMFKDINVNMEIKPLGSAYMGIVFAGKNDAMDFERWAGLLDKPDFDLSIRTSASMMNFTHNNDQHYNDLYDQFVASNDPAKAQQLSKELDMYAISQHWAVNLSAPNSSRYWWPYVKGYSGELYLGQATSAFVWARLWIDKSLKK